MHEFNVSRRNLIIAGVVFLGIVLVGLGWVVWNHHTAPDRIPDDTPGKNPMTPNQAKTRFEMLGKVTTEEIKKLLDLKTQVILVNPRGGGPNPYVTTAIDDFWDQEGPAIAKAATDAGLNVVTAQVTNDHTIFDIFQSYPDAGAFIVHKLPGPMKSDWDKLKKPGPKIIQISDDSPFSFAELFVTKGVTKLAIVYREHASDDPPKYQTDQECFDYYYKIISR